MPSNNKSFVKRYLYGKISHVKNIPLIKFITTTYRITRAMEKADQVRFVGLGVQLVIRSISKISLDFI